VASGAGKRCEDVFELRPNPWGVWDTSSSLVGFCDGETLGPWDVKGGTGFPVEGEFQFAVNAPPPFFDRVTVYLARVIQKGGKSPDVVPEFGVYLKLGAGNAFNQKPWSGVKVNCNVAGAQGYGTQDLLFSVQGQYATRCVFVTRTLSADPDNRDLRIVLRVLFDRCGNTDNLVQINNPLPAGFVTKDLPP
jgi:hypothetical protein